MEDEPVDYEVVLHSELQELRQKRDYLIGMGNYEGADYIQEQIADLSYRLNLNFVQIVPI